MGDELKWINYENKRILLCDFKNLDETQTVNLFANMEKEVLKANITQPVLVINDVTGASPYGNGKKAYRKYREATKDIEQYLAMVGAGVMMQTVGKMLSLFVKGLSFHETLDSAKEWLAQK